MKVETLSEKYINEIGHAFGYYEYAQGEKGLVSAYSSKDAVVSYINGYVEMVLQAGMLYTTGPQQEAFIAYKRCDEKVGLKAGQKLIKGCLQDHPLVKWYGCSAFSEAAAHLPLKRN